MKVGLWKIAHARSGDKADRADIGLFAYDAPTCAVLKREVTRERLAAHFADICKGPVEIYPLDNLLALKIVLNAALQGVRRARCAWTVSARPSRHNCCAWRSRRLPICRGSHAHERSQAQAARAPQQ